MAVQIVLDVTSEFNSGLESGTPGLVKIDTGGFDYSVVHFINASGDIIFKHTNDSGDIQGVSDGSAVSSDNALPLQGVNLADGSSGDKCGPGDSIYRFQSYAKYLWLDGSGDPSVIVDKLLVRLYKIH